jgi:zinc protease
LLFAGHPYGLNVAGSQKAIENFSTQDLREIYRKHARPDLLVLAVSGDVKAEEIFNQAESLFGDWQKPAVPKSKVVEEEVPPEVPSAPKIFRLERDRSQVHIILGFLGTTLTSPDRYSMEILDTILNGQSGRLFSDLRDKQSLAYSLSSFSLLGTDTGSFGFYIGTRPDKKEEAIKALWKQIYSIREEPVSETELQRAKNILIGSYELSLQTHSSQALEMALNETYGLGQNFGSRYSMEVNRIDAEAVLQVARKYLLMDNYILVTVGAESPSSAAEGALESTDTAQPADLQKPAEEAGPETTTANQNN